MKEWNWCNVQNHRLEMTRLQRSDTRDDSSQATRWLGMTRPKYDRTRGDSNLYQFMNTQNDSTRSEEDSKWLETGYPLTRDNSRLDIKWLDKTLAASPPKQRVTWGTVNANLSNFKIFKISLKESLNCHWKIRNLGTYIEENMLNVGFHYRR